MFLCTFYLRRLHSCSCWLLRHFYNSFEVMELAMHYHYTKYVAVLNRIEEPTPKYMVELFISC